MTETVSGGLTKCLPDVRLMDGIVHMESLGKL